MLQGEGPEEPRYRSHPEIKHRKPHFQYTLYSECGFLYVRFRAVWSSRCPVLRQAMLRTCSHTRRTMRYAVLAYDMQLAACYALSGTDMRYGATRTFKDESGVEVELGGLTERMLLPGDNGEDITLGLEQVLPPYETATTCPILIQATRPYWPMRPPRYVRY
eukprot:745223-Rhodomonas_salina.2